MHATVLLYVKPTLSALAFSAIQMGSAWMRSAESAGFISVAMAGAPQASSVRWRVCADVFELGEACRSGRDRGCGGETEARLRRLQSRFDGGALVSAEVVHDHDVAGAQRPTNPVRCKLRTSLRDRSIEDARRGQAVVAQGGGRLSPMTEWRCDSAADSHR